MRDKDNIVIFSKRKRLMSDSNHLLNVDGDFRAIREHLTHNNIGWTKK